jgi:hypothetical protein
LRPRWLPHCLFGLSVSTGTAATELLLSGSELGVGVVFLIAGWVPLLGLLLKPVAQRKRESLVYEKELGH